ncbi:MAG: DNA-processing protein DprA, partial [Candidatus Eisenbacteria bacterium]
MGTPREVARGGKGYPERLESLERPPHRIFLEGPWVHDGPVVAIVGSRDANGDGLDTARLLASELVRSGAAVISGLARGIDAAAHEGALDAGGMSGAVLGTPLDRVYPRRHAVLQRRLAGSLGLLSELAPGTSAFPGAFAIRNRLLAAMADAIVVVQGRAHSGSLLTAEAARSLGRPVGAIPWDPREKQAAAPLSLLWQGTASLVRDAKDVLELIERAAGKKPPAPAPIARRAPAGRGKPRGSRSPRRAPLALPLSGAEGTLLAALRRYA